VPGSRSPPHPSGGVAVAAGSSTTGSRSAGPAGYGQPAPGRAGGTPV